MKEPLIPLSIAQKIVTKAAKEGFEKGKAEAATLVKAVAELNGSTKRVLEELGSSGSVEKPRATKATEDEREAARRKTIAANEATNAIDFAGYARDNPGNHAINAYLSNAENDNAEAARHHKLTAESHRLASRNVNGNAGLFKQHLDAAHLHSQAAEAHYLLHDADAYSERYPDTKHFPLPILADHALDRGHDEEHERFREGYEDAVAEARRKEAKSLQELKSLRGLVALSGEKKIVKSEDEHNSFHQAINETGGHDRIARGAYADFIDEHGGAHSWVSHVLRHHPDAVTVGRDPTGRIVANFSKEVHLGALERRPVKATIEFGSRRHQTPGDLAIIGSIGTHSAGQIDSSFIGHGASEHGYRVEDIKPQTGWNHAKIHDFLNTWKRWHRNIMRAGTPEQEEHLLNNQVSVTYPASHFDATRDSLRAAGLEPHNGYSYGSQWLREEVPDEVIHSLVKLPYRRERKALPDDISISQDALNATLEATHGYDRSNHNARKAVSKATLALEAAKAGDNCEASNNHYQAQLRHDDLVRDYGHDPDVYALHQHASDLHKAAYQHHSREGNKKVDVKAFRVGERIVNADAGPILHDVIEDHNEATGDNLHSGSEATRNARQHALAVNGYESDPTIWHVQQSELPDVHLAEAKRFDRIAAHTERQQGVGGASKYAREAAAMHRTAAAVWQHRHSVGLKALTRTGLITKLVADAANYTKLANRLSAKARLSGNKADHLEAFEANNAAEAAHGLLGVYFKDTNPEEAKYHSYMQKKHSDRGAISKDKSEIHERLRHTAALDDLRELSLQLKSDVIGTNDATGGALIKPAGGELVKRKAETEHPPTIPSSPEKGYSGEVDKWLSRSSLPDRTKNRYGDKLKTVLGKVSEPARQAIFSTLGENVKFHQDAKNLTRHYNRTGEMREELKPGYRIAGYVSSNPESTTLHLAGGSDLDKDYPGDTTEEIYAHELGHVLDNQDKLSSHEDWHSAWKDEPSVSEYSRHSPYEGFAEFYRHLLTHGHEAVQNTHPKSYEFLKRNNLV